MKEIDLELNHTYLLRFGSSDTISSATVLMITDKAYLIRWNNRMKSNNVWELKEKMYKYYHIVEDISDHVKDQELNESLNTLRVETTWEDCTKCGGTGKIYDIESTTGERTCPKCWGSGVMIKMG